jgi:hypothetical protein
LRFAFVTEGIDACARIDRNVSKPERRCERYAKNFADDLVDGPGSASLGPQSVTELPDVFVADCSQRQGGAFAKVAEEGIVFVNTYKSTNPANFDCVRAVLKLQTII